MNTKILLAAIAICKKYRRRCRCYLITLRYFVICGMQARTTQIEREYKQKLRELDYRKPQEETTHLVAAVESKAHLRPGGICASKITHIIDTKDFKNKIL
jgi:hypothetical protein